MDDLRAPGVLDSADALVRLALAGDEAAFARIVRLHRSAMVRVALVVTLDLALAEESVAATWPVAWDRIESLREPARIEAWLCGMAAREAREVVVHGSSRLDVAQPDRAAVPGSSARAAAAASDPELVAALGGLRPDDRVFLALGYVAGQTPEELGQATGSAPRAAAAHTRGVGRSLAARLGHVAGGTETAEEQLARRMRALADVPVGYVNADAVARVAKITRHDRRNRLVSLAFAGVVALVVVALPYLGESGPWPALAAGMSSPLPWAVPSPDPSVEPAPGGLPAPH